MKEISFYYEIEPVPKARPRLGRNGTYTPAKTKDFENAIKKITTEELASAFFPEFPKESPLFFQVEFYLKPPKKNKRVMPVVKPDLDNLTKTIMDALNGLAYNDDNQICKIKASKYYSERPHIKVLIQVME